jgi:hypothetical protein
MRQNWYRQIGLGKNNTKTEGIMMAKKIIFLVMVMMLAATYFATDSNAAVTWHTCTVDRVGPGGGQIFVQLTSPAFAQKWFLAPSEGGKELLAIALTAMTSGMQVYVGVDLTLGSYPTIVAFYLTQ